MTRDKLVEALMTVELPSWGSPDWYVEDNGSVISLDWEQRDIFNVADGYYAHGLFREDDGITNSVRYAFMCAFGEAVVNLKNAGVVLSDALQNVYSAMQAPGPLPDSLSWSDMRTACDTVHNLGEEDYDKWREATMDVMDADGDYWYSSRVHHFIIAHEDHWHIETSVDFGWQFSLAYCHEYDIPLDATVEDLRNALTDLSFYMTGGLV